MERGSFFVLAHRKNAASEITSPTARKKIMKIKKIIDLGIVYYRINITYLYVKPPYACRCVSCGKEERVP